MFDYVFEMEVLSLRVRHDDFVSIVDVRVKYIHHDYDFFSF